MQLKDPTLKIPYTKSKTTRTGFCPAQSQYTKLLFWSLQILFSSLFFPTDFDDVLGLKQGVDSSHEMKDITAEKHLLRRLKKKKKSNL